MNHVSEPVMSKYITYEETYRKKNWNCCKLCGDKFEGAYCVDCWGICWACGLFCDREDMLEGEDGLYCYDCFDDIEDALYIKEPEV